MQIKFNKEELRQGH